MPNPQHIDILTQGVQTWNAWRASDHTLRPDLSDLDLSRGTLAHVNFRRTNLSDTILSGANLVDANFTRANLNNADMRSARIYGGRFYETILNSANLTGANLGNCTFDRSTFIGANLREAYLFRTQFYEADLKGADFTEAISILTVYDNLDLSVVKGLDTVRHRGPSTIGVDTLYRSAGGIPESFLRGCGVPDSFTTYVSSFIGAQQAIQFYSCFVSYSSKDEEFVQFLYSKLQHEHIRVWFAPADVKAGEKLHEQIDHAIQVHDKVLIVLSENSLESEWVMTEIRKARKDEIQKKRRKLFPIRLMSYETLQEWQCFDSDCGKDLAIEVREYFIPDFSKWKNKDAFEVSFDRLLKDLRAEDRPNSHSELTS